MNSGECSICIEKFNKTVRSPVKCAFCEFVSCRSCCSKYILNETTPKCMNCSKEWTRKFLTTQFTKTFMAIDYKKYNEKVLFDREQALLPATQIVVERMIRQEKCDKELDDLEIEYRRKQTEIRQKYMLDNVSSRNHGQRSVFVRACPDENCRGFLSSQWKCGICDKWTCPECHELKGLNRDVEHTCNADNLATARLLDKDTRPCPTCGTGIFKIEGCDQMWCTQCHTAFSWRTGRKEDHIHNPHYFEYMRRTGNVAPRNPNEVQCGQELDNTFGMIIGRLMRGWDEGMMDRNKMGKVNLRTNIEIERLEVHICELVRRLVHVRRNDIPQYERAVGDVNGNEGLRINYLRNRITKEEFQRDIQRVEKKNQKNMEILNVMRTIVTAGTDIMYRFRDALSKPEYKTDLNYQRETFNIIKEFDAIVEYANECFEDISKTYNSKRLYIDTGFYIKSEPPKVKIAEILDRHMNNTSSISTSSRISSSSSIYNSDF